MIRKILIPLTIYSTLMFYFYNYLFGIEKTILASIYHPKEDYIHVLKEGILKWQNAVPEGGHLWYLYVYVLVVLMFPALKGLKRFIDQQKDGNIKLILLLFLFLIFNDLSFNGFFEFSHHTFNGALGGAVWVLIGSVIYKYKDRFRDNYLYGMIGLLVFVAGNLVRSYIQYRCYLLESPTSEPLLWYTSYAMISILSLTIVSVKSC